MGLDCSHDCYSGGYGTFNAWRAEVARVVGIPLELMEGFLRIPVEGEFDISFLPDGSTPYTVPRISLPIKWETLAPDPLLILLSHSDCDGIIEAKDCGPIADRLQKLLPMMPGADAPFRRNMQEVTQQFINGLRQADAAGEDVQFG